MHMTTYCTEKLVVAHHLLRITFFLRIAVNVNCTPAACSACERPGPACANVASILHSSQPYPVRGSCSWPSRDNPRSHGPSVAGGRRGRPAPPGRVPAAMSHGSAAGSHHMAGWPAGCSGCFPPAPGSSVDKWNSARVTPGPSRSATRQER